MRIVVADIACVQFVQQYAVVRMATAPQHSVRIALSTVMTCLPLTDFIQCHRSWVVNLQRIERVELTAGLIRLTNGTQAPMGRTFRQQVQQRLCIME